MDETKLHTEFHTLDLKHLLSNHEETLGKLRVWKTQEKRKREQHEFIEVNNLWAAFPSTSRGSRKVTA